LYVYINTYTLSAPVLFRTAECQSSLLITVYVGVRITVTEHWTLSRIICPAEFSKGDVNTCKMQLQ